MYVLKILGSLVYLLDLLLPFHGVPLEPLLPPRRHCLVLVLVLRYQLVQRVRLTLGLDHGPLASVGVAQIVLVVERRRLKYACAQLNLATRET